MIAQRPTLLLLLFVLIALSTETSGAAVECRWVEMSDSRGFDGPVTTLFVDSDATTGRVLWAAGAFRGVDGNFVNRMARLIVTSEDVARWEPAEGHSSFGFIDGEVSALIQVEAGPVGFYAAGAFTGSGGSVLNHIARRNEPEGIWLPLTGPEGTGLLDSSGDVEVHDLMEWDDGSGPALFVAGRFDTAGGLPADGIAKWDGSTWTPLPDPVSGSRQQYLDLQIFDGALYVGADTGPIRRWNGSGWSVVGTGFDRSTHSLAVWDDGGGARLYAAGSAPASSGSSDSLAFVARWSQNRWSDLLLGADKDRAGRAVFALAAIDDGPAPGLYAGGDVRRMGGQDVWHVGRWDGSNWHPLSDGVRAGLGAPALALAAYGRPDGNQVLVAGGRFTTAGAEAISHLAMWNGTEWSDLPTQRLPFGAEKVRAFAEAVDETGSTIFMSGELETLAGQRGLGIWRWQDNQWATLLPAEDFFDDTGDILALTLWDDGSGPALYAGGDRLDIGTTSFVSLAKWNGSQWTEVGGPPGPSLSGDIYDLQPWDDGSGPSLFAGGDFFSDQVDGLRGVARWDGTWREVGDGPGPPAGVRDLEVWDDGTGEALYAVGTFQRLVARWDGTAWTQLSDSVCGGGSNEIFDLEPWDDGTGTALWGVDVSRGLYRWAGDCWEQVNPGFSFDTETWVLESWDDDGDGRADLYVGGENLLNDFATSVLIRYDGDTWSQMPVPGGPDARGLINALQAGETSLLVGGMMDRGTTRRSPYAARWTCEDPCAAAPNQLLCLGPDRFQVDITWRDFQGNEGSGRVVPFQTLDSGIYFFFGAENWELLLKVLDGCGFNDHFWVFSAATTNVEYTLTITDTYTGTRRSYFNPLGVAAPAVTDTSAFQTCGAGDFASSSSPENWFDDTGFQRERSVDLGVAKGNCVSTDTTLCLEDGRFALEIDWRDFDGNEGPGKVVPGTPSDDSGLFQFFGENNWEVLVKVLDACSFNDRFWVFSAATTNVEYTLRVTDTNTGQSVSYVNPLGNAASAVTDTDAFSTCP